MKVGPRGPVKASRPWDPRWACVPGHTLDPGLCLPQVQCHRYRPASPTLRPALTPEKALRVCRGLAGHESWTTGTFQLSRVGRVGEDRGGGGGLS